MIARARQRRRRRLAAACIAVTLLALGAALVGILSSRSGGCSGGGDMVFCGGSLPVPIQPAGEAGDAAVSNAAFDGDDGL